MIPEFYLVIILLAVFAVDFIMHRSEKKHDVLFGVTVALMLVLPFRIALLSEPAEAVSAISWMNSSERIASLSKCSPNRKTL